MTTLAASWHIDNVRTSPPPPSPYVRRTMILTHQLFCAHVPLLPVVLDGAVPEEGSPLINGQSMCCNPSCFLCSTITCQVHGAARLALTLCLMFIMPPAPLL